MLKTMDIMTTNVITVSPETYVEEAYDLMKESRIRHLPVVDRDGALVGIVSDRDLRGVLVPFDEDGTTSPPGGEVQAKPTSSGNEKKLSFHPSGVTVSEIMARDVFTVSPSTDIAEAASLIYFQKIGGLPVVDGEGRLTGIITAIDLISLLIKMVNAIGTSNQIDVILGENPRAFTEVSGILEENGGDIISVWMSGAECERAERIYHFRLAPCDTSPMVSNLEEAGFTVLAA